MACPVCIQCGRCGKEPVFKAVYVKGDCLFCGHRNDAGARTCAKCGTALPLPPGVREQGTEVCSRKQEKDRL